MQIALQAGFRRTHTLIGVVDAWRQWGNVVVAALLLLPAALVVAAAMARWRRRRGAAPSWAWRTSLTEVLLIVATAPWLVMVLTPLPGGRAVEWMPQWDLGVQVSDPGIALAQVGGNLLVFAAFGFLAPVRWRMGLGAVALLTTLAAFTVEAVQYLAELGRVSSINDVALNAAGAVIAALCSRRWWLRSNLDALGAAGVR